MKLSDRQKCCYRGLVNSFGAYEAFYETSLLQSYNSSQISWIGTVEAFLLLVFSLISGPVFDRGYFRALQISGSFLTVFGLMMTSLATEYWQVFLAQGVCVGLGSGCLLVPSMAIGPTYFTTKRALATGIIAAGGSIGSVIYPIMFRRLQPQIGFPWAVRVMAFLALATLAVSITIMKPRLSPPKKARAILDLKAFTSILYSLFCVGLFLTFVGLYIPIFYIVVYAQQDAKIDADMSFYLLSILNASSVAGRILPGLLADRFGSLETMIIFTVGTAIFAYAWTVIHTLAELILFAIVYGFLSGAVVSLPVTVVAGLTPEMQLVGTWMGMSFGVCSVGVLIGSPIAGSIINVGAHRFSGGYLFSASMTMAGGITFVIVKLVQYLRAHHNEPVSRIRSSRPCKPPLKPAFNTNTAVL
jgi:MFS family permease